MKSQKPFSPFPEVQEMRKVLSDPHVWDKQMRRLDSQGVSRMDVMGPGGLGLPFETCVGEILVDAGFRPMFPRPTQYSQHRYRPTSTPGGIIIANRRRDIIELDGLFVCGDVPVVIEVKIGTTQGALKLNRIGKIREEVERAWSYARSQHFNEIGYCLVMPNMNPVRRSSLRANLSKIGGELVETSSSKRVTRSLLQSLFSRPPRL